MKSLATGLLWIGLLFAGNCGTAIAAVVALDLTSGVDNGQDASFNSYVESGFSLQMDLASNHIDRPPNVFGDLGFHNGPGNTDDISWTLSFGGSVFSLLDVDIGGFGNGASSVTVTGSNGLFQSLSVVGSNSIAGLTNITFATFNIDQDGGSQIVGLNGLTVNNSVVPIPAALPLLLSALGVFGFMGWRRKAVAA